MGDVTRRAAEQIQRNRHGPTWGLTSAQPFEMMIKLITHKRFHRDHRWTPEHLSEFVDGDLSLRGRSRLQRHVDNCPDCYRALVTLQRMLDRIHRLPRPDADETPDIAAAVRRQLDEA
jgi:putative zinc finger protein